MAPVALRGVLSVVSVALISALHPRPPTGPGSDPAQFARWLVHESDYAIIATHEGDDVFTNVISISDGVGYEDSTGIIYTYIPSLDRTYHDVMVNPKVSFSWSEMALDGGSSGGCQNSTAENPTCGRLTISGQLTKVPAEKKALALESLFSRHPVMKDWSHAHMFEPFWVDPASITEFWLISMFGGAKPITLSAYLNASSQRDPPVPAGHHVCSQCGLVYDKHHDGDGLDFDNLPGSWACPVCGAPKAWFKEADRQKMSLCESGTFYCRSPAMAVVFMSVSLLIVAIGCGAFLTKRKEVKEMSASMSTSLQTVVCEENGHGS